MAEPATANETVQRLRSELSFMYELCQVVASNSELPPILDWIVQKTTGMLSAEEGSIRLLGPDAGTPMLKTLVRKEKFGLHVGSWPPVVSMNVMGFLVTDGEPLASTDLRNDPRFPALRDVESRIRSVLAVPLRVDNRFTGMLAVTSATPGRQWTGDEAQLLVIVASNSASVIEKARLKVEAEEKRRLEERHRQMERELDTARGIQMSLVPSRAVRLGAWEVLGRVIPARQVGGDSFDYFPVAGGRLAVSIADVSGKGVPASLLMSSVQASVRAFCDGRVPIPEAIAHVNAAVARSASGKFITLFYGEIDPAAGVLRYVNAGHNYPLVRRRDGTLVELPAGGLPLGILDDAAYEPGECALLPGDALLLYSDGITEALDARGQEFGEERLRAEWERVAGLVPEAVIERMFDAVGKFRGAARQSDDMALVVAAAPAG